jgi:lipoprotein NlpI
MGYKIEIELPNDVDILSRISDEDSDDPYTEVWNWVYENKDSWTESKSIAEDDYDFTDPDLAAKDFVSKAIDCYLKELSKTDLDDELMDDEPLEKTFDEIIDGVDTFLENAKNIYLPYLATKSKKH